MKEKFKVSYQQEDNERIVLKDSIPLKTPLSLQIELASACNFRCKFCMHGNPDLIKKGVYKIGIMEFDLFKKIVDDLKGFPNKIKFVSLQCRGESLLNPRLVDMIRYLKEANVTKEIVLNTNASLLTEELSLGMIEAGLDNLRISIEAVTQEGYEEVSGVKIDFSKLLKEIEFFYKNRKQCYVYTKIIDCNMTEVEIQLFFQLFEEISDSVFIEKPINLWKDAGLDKELFTINRWGLDISSTQICPRVFFSYAVHFDGTIVSCDSDWKENSPLGNVVKDNMVEIWNGDKFNEMRYKHLKKDTGEYTQCVNCFIYQECLAKDRLDEAVDRLVLRFERGKNV